MNMPDHVDIMYHALPKDIAKIDDELISAMQLAGYALAGCETASDKETEINGKLGRYLDFAFAE